MQFCTGVVNTLMLSCLGCSGVVVMVFVVEHSFENLERSASAGSENLPSQLSILRCLPIAARGRQQSICDVNILGCVPYVAIDLTEEFVSIVGAGVVMCWWENVSVCAGCTPTSCSQDPGN